MCEKLQTLCTYLGVALIGFAVGWIVFGSGMFDTADNTGIRNLESTLSDVKTEQRVLQDTIRKQDATIRDTARAIQLNDDDIRAKLADDRRIIIECEQLFEGAIKRAQSKR